MTETKNYLNEVGLKLYVEKSAKNVEGLSAVAKLMQESTVYWYIGIVQRSRSEILPKAFTKHKDVILARVARLSKTNLMVKILFKQ